MDVNQMAALMIRTLMRDAGVSDHVVLPHGGKAFSSELVLGLLDGSRVPDPVGYLHTHKTRGETEFDKKQLTDGDRKDGWREEPLYAQPGPTQDAYMRACRALHWAQAQLRAHGVEPDAIEPNAPHYPPDDHVFSTVGAKLGDGTPDAALAIGEHAFRAGFKAATEYDWHERSAGLEAEEEEKAWSAYDPPEHIKELS